MSRIARTAIPSLLALCLAAVETFATGVTPPAVTGLYLAAVTPWLVTIDLREHRLPNALVIPGIAVGLASCATEWIATGRSPLVPLVAGAGYSAFLLILHLIGGMGMGDVKLGAALGLASWNSTTALLSPVIAFLVGGAVAVILLAAGRRGMKIAFGPYLLGGYWATVVLVALVRFD